MGARTAGVALAACATLACAAWPGPELDWDLDWRRLDPGLGWGPGWLAGEPEPAPPSLVFQPPSDLPPPQGLVATSGLYRRVALVWDPVLLAGVGGYLVESAAQAEGEFVQRAVLRDRGALAWVDEGEGEGALDDGETRHYRLRAFDRAGRVSSLASEVAAATTAPLPDPPEGLRAFSRQPRSVPLLWRPAADPGVTGYSVERAPGPEGPFEVVAELDGRHATHVLDTGLGDLRVLHYRVSSRNAGGERGPPSEVLRAVTKPAPLPPVGLRVVSRRLGAVELAWDANVESDLESYRLLRRRADADDAQTVTSVGAASTGAEDEEVGAGERVTYTLVAVDRDGLASRASNAVATEAPGYGWRARASAGGVRLRWERREHEGFVRARVTRTSWPWRRLVLESDAGELLDAAVSPGRVYRYVIELERADATRAPPSQPLEIRIPEPGAGFVEIQGPASRLPPPGDVPR